MTMGSDRERANFARVQREVPLPPGWKWATWSANVELSGQRPERT